MISRMIPASLASQSPLDSFLTPLLANWPLFAALLALLLLVKILANPRFKGWLGEASVNRGLLGLDPSLYRSFHDLYLPRPDGKGTTQIDHVVVSPFGIFVIETKNYRGWIFGGEKQRQWTQQIYRRKEKFQNPLHQNLLHIRALMDFLHLPETGFHSVIFFIGDAEFKTPMPGNVLVKGLRPWIENHRSTILDPDQVVRITTLISQHEQNTDRKVVACQHLIDRKMRG